MTDKFRKMVAIEPTKLLPEWDQKLKSYSEESIFYRDIPTQNDEIIQRIGDADCVLLSYTSHIDQKVLEACPHIRYIGMCCSLYSPESANVDILTAVQKGITVTGIRDYGDEGVKEYVISELVRLLHGRDRVQWRDEPMELTGLKVGILGMGTLGTLIARTMHFFGAKISYYSRTRKPRIETELGIIYRSLDEVLAETDILITCLNKNVVLMGEREFTLFGDGKILMNVSISPSHEIPALVNWLKRPGNYALSDTIAGLGHAAAELPNAFCQGSRSAGLTYLAKQRLGKKVVENIESYLSF